MSETRLANIETSQAECVVLLKALTNKVEERIEQDDRRHDRMAKSIYGNNGAPGILIKLDRLEQAQERWEEVQEGQRWFMRKVVGAVVVLFIGGVWALLNG